VLPGIVGSIQANEALKLIAGYGDPLVGRLLTFDAQTTSFGEVKVRRDPACPVCGEQANRPETREEPRLRSVG
jgi:bacteriocin biosynthesis cyclodehydratase domain-containing protein